MVSNRDTIQICLMYVDCRRKLGMKFSMKKLGDVGFVRIIYLILKKIVKRKFMNIYYINLSNILKVMTKLQKLKIVGKCHLTES